MSKQYPGGIIVANPTAPSGPYENSTAPGIWTIDQAANYIKQGNWPTAGNQAPDAQFNYVTMLLHGDGTNGAQNNTFLDSSSNAYSITRNGNATQGSFSPYGSNWSNYLTSSTKFRTTSFTAISAGQDFTLEAWVFQTTQTGGTLQCIATPRVSSGSWYFGVYNNNIFYYDESASVFEGTTLTPNVWHHIAFSRSGTTHRLFIDGALVGTKTATAQAETGAALAIGSDDSSSNTVTNPFYGYVSNLRVVIGTALYTAAFTPSTTPLTAVSGTAFLGCQSNRFIDNSSNNYTINVAAGSPSVQRFNPFGTSTAYSTATFGGSAYCDGTGDYLSFAEQTLSGDFTLEGWFYPTNPSGTKQQCLFGGTSTNTQLDIDEYSYGGIGYYNNGVRFDLGRFSGGPYFYHFCWNHFAFVKSGTTVTLYINGVSQAGVGGSVTDSGTFALSSVLGSVPYGISYLGYANIRVSTTARYSANFTPSTTPWTSDGSTKFLLQMTNGAIYDNAMMNDLETVGNAQISTSVVKYGTGSMYFDGTGDYLKGLAASTNFQFGTGDFTIEMWVYTSNLATFQTLLDTRASDTTVAYGIFINDSGYPYWYDANGFQTSSIAIASNTWTYLAFLRGSGTLRIYVNGVQGSFATNTNSMNPTGSTLIGMNVSGTAPYLGYIDDLRVTKGYARTPTTPTAAFPNTGPN